MSVATITKTYALERPNEGDICGVEITTRWGAPWDGYDYDTDVCGKKAVYVVMVNTERPNGRVYRNRAAFCKEHASKRYRQWFKAWLTYDEGQGWHLTAEDA